jgi:hypothetical protein
MREDRHARGVGSSQMTRRNRTILIIAAIGVLLIAGGGLAIALSGGGSDEKKSSFKDASDLQKVSFQEPADPGPDPFTEPADVKGPKKVDVPKGQGPFGGTGSDLVCDRNLLIRSLRADPAKLRAWAQVAGIAPTYKTVARYIARLHPVTLTRDTRVTNHSFVDGHVTAFQSILAAGTAVLVDRYGRPVARCRCGNPLTPPQALKTATCSGCPTDYHPPPPCHYGSSSFYRRYYGHDYYTNEDYDLIFIEKYRSDCYDPYPDPPTVTIIDVFRRPSSTTSTTSTTPGTTTTPQTSTERDRGGTATTTSPRNTGPDCPPGYTGYNCQPEHPATETTSSPPPTQTQTTSGGGGSEHNYPSEHCQPGENPADCASP